MATSTGFAAENDRRDSRIERNEGSFITRCELSHRAADDPIVAFGQPGASHLHDFVGNRGVNAGSTYEQLKRNPKTTCDGEGHTGSYWFPTVLVNGKPTEATRTNVYYRSRKLDPRAIKPFPQNLRMIAGDARATREQPGDVANWDCVRSGDRRSVQTPNCAANDEFLKFRIEFPECWDGVRIDSPDHKSHMAYANRGECPRTHPVAVPGITVSVNFEYGKAIRRTDRITLSSGGVFSGHADFINTWDEATLGRLVAGCLNAAKSCDKGEKPDVRPAVTPVASDTTIHKTRATSGSAPAGADTTAHAGHGG
ncbi:DUF1996 domain-containing protein [Micromonospora citrea]|uniref:DUF1996 domain-containing protein n=1 Tax=Micromonospora citrea TaxID=47855 RepID=UPI003C50A6A3